MAISIKSDYIALIGQNIISRANKSLSTSMQRLSTGYKINATADDSAGYITAVGLNSKLRGLKIAQSNNQNSYAMLSTAESVLGNVHDIASRLRELAIQGSSNTMTQEQRNSLQLEANQLTSELYRVINASKYNDMQILGRDNRMNLIEIADMNRISGLVDTSPASLKQTIFTPLTEAEAVAQGYTLIKSEQDYLNMYRNGTVIRGKYILMADIDTSSISEELEQLIANTRLVGEFNGNGHTIDINFSNSSHGLFYEVENSRIKNVNINLMNLTSYNSNGVGGVALFINRSEISNVHVAGKITIKGYGNYVGGICNAFGNDSRIINSSFVGEIQTDNPNAQHIGGIAATSAQFCTMDTVYSNLKVTAQSWINKTIGGIVSIVKPNDLRLIKVYSRVDHVPTIASVGQIAGEVSGKLSINGPVFFDKKKTSDEAYASCTGTIEGGNFIPLNSNDFRKEVLKTFNIPEFCYVDESVQTDFEVNRGKGNTRLQIGTNSESTQNSLKIGFEFDITGFFVDLTTTDRATVAIKKIDNLIKKHYQHNVRLVRQCPDLNLSSTTKWYRLKM